jgi:hypothetical protein
MGGNHADYLHGGAGNDYIDGGWHTDTCVNDVADIYAAINCEING